MSFDASSTDAIITTAKLAPAKTLLSPYTEKNAADAEISKADIDTNISENLSFFIIRYTKESKNSESSKSL